MIVTSTESVMGYEITSNLVSDDYLTLQNRDKYYKWLKAVHADSMLSKTKFIRLTELIR